jgi:hypothetical protein
VQNLNQSKIVAFLKSQAMPDLRFWLVIAIVMILLFFVSVLYEIALQQYRIRNYIPTKAKILYSDVKKKSKWRIPITRWGALISKWQYEPQIVYSYLCEKYPYLSHNITVINPNNSTQEWAEEIVAKYYPGETVIAYCDPKNPQKSFLVYEVAFWPYEYSLSSFFPLCVFTVSYFGISKIYNNPKSPSQISANYYELKPDGIESAFQWVLWFNFLYYVVGMVIGISYFSLASKPYELFPQILCSIYFILGLIPLGFFGYGTLQRMKFSLPYFWISRPNLQTGEKIQIKIKQQFKNTIQLASSEIALLCATYYKDKDKFGKDCIRRQNSHIYKAALCKERIFMPGEFLEFEDNISIPLNVYKGGFSGKNNEFPFYRWYFEITNKRVDGFVYMTKYFVNCE